jgi:hypothetical protein
MVAPTPVMRIQRSGVVELTNIIDVLSEIGNKWGHTRRCHMATLRKPEQGRR